MNKCILAFASFFVFLFLGVGHTSEVETLSTAKVKALNTASKNALNQKFSFGKSSGDVEIYIVTDWLCSVCQGFEPDLEKLVPELYKLGKVTYVDVAFHKGTENFIPYNVSFLVKNHNDDYLSLRRGLSELAQKTKTPTEAQVKEIFNARKLTLNLLDKTQSDEGVKYFAQLQEILDPQATPALFVYNKGTQKYIVFYGPEEITLENIKKGSRLPKLKSSASLCKPDYSASYC